ncbi:MAG: ATP phosphoribosyltransferase regulatory subunit [Clostridium sp.]|nr:ATP phosphoribosyltransferase regulatory subunit [Clostridium sp.]
MKLTVNTPEGTRDRLFSECQERRQVQNRLTRLFRQRGFLEVSTPDTEFYDLFAQSGSAIPQERMVKVADPSGMFCVMRPDSTTPIARVAATKLRSLPLPQRLYYDQTVYRSNPAHNGGSREIPQCGVELIGAKGMKADLEIIVMAIDALRSCGVPGFHVELGHAGFFRDLAARLNVQDDVVEEMRALIEGKNFAALNAFLTPHRGNPACAALERLSRLFGGHEVLTEAEKLAGKTDAVDYLRSLYDELSAAGYGQYVRFDLGMVHQIDYYTGVVFRGYVEGAGDAVLSGGRYDSLVGVFGRDAQATGFAVDVDAVARTLPETALPALRTVVHYEPGYLAQALEAVDSRPAGTCELSLCRTLESSENLARDKGAEAVLVFDKNGERTVLV